MVFGIASLTTRRLKYVRERIDTKTPVEIGIEMLDEIISEDPRSTQGIGGDKQHDDYGYWLATAATSLLVKTL